MISLGLESRQEPGVAGAMERTKIDAEKLAVGMYVSQLDRPWLETPFLFQGFETPSRFHGVDLPGGL